MSFDPSQVFAQAQQAMSSEDWETFFSCLSTRDQLRFAEINVQAIGPGPLEGLTALAIEHGAPSERLARIVQLGVEIVASAQGQMRTVPLDLAASNRHRALVLARQEAARAALESMSDLDIFNAKAERAKRAVLGGGSISSSMFVGETLEGLTVSGSRATATRRTPGGGQTPIAFVKTAGAWRISLMPSRRARPR